jgi:hypothetical protein
VPLSSLLHASSEFGSHQHVCTQHQDATGHDRSRWLAMAVRTCLPSPCVRCTHAPRWWVCGVDDWYLLDSCAPRSVKKLSLWEVASSFDADVSYAVMAPPETDSPGRQPLPAAHVRDMVRPALRERRSADMAEPGTALTSARGRAWPEARCDAAMSSAPLRLLLWLDPACLGSSAAARQQFNVRCRSVTANVLLYADFHQRGDHMLLTV